MQGCEEKEKVLLLWERALTLFYENDTELFVTGAQERTIAGKIAMHMDKIYREIFPMPELVIDIEYNRMDTDIKPKYPGSEDKKKRCCNIKECVIIWATKQPERGHYESDSMAVKTDAGDDDPAADPCRVAGKVVCGVSASLFGMGFLSAG